MRVNEHGEPYAEGAAVDRWRTPFDGRCWVCGSTDVTSEHKFKRANLRRVGGDDELMWTDGTRWQRLRSSNDQRARFRVKNLCAQCNNERSQPADRAWDRFSEFVAENWTELGSVRGLDLRDVYGPDHVVDGFARMQEYVARHLGCRISEAFFPVPDDLRDFLEGRRPDTIAMCLFYSHERAALMRYIKGEDTLARPPLSIGPLISSLSKSQRRATVFVTEICVGPIGVLVKWSDSEAVGTSFGTYANLYPRSSLPYPEIHEAPPAGPDSSGPSH